MKSLYSLSYFRPGEEVDKKAFDRDLKLALAEKMPKFRPIPGVMPDMVMTMSHYQRMHMNALNRAMAANKRTKWLPWLGERITNVAMQPQSCHAWVGLEVTGCVKHGTRDGNVTNGIYYKITYFDDDGVDLLMNPEFSQNYTDKLARTMPKVKPFVPQILDFARGNQRSPKDVENFMKSIGVGKKLDKGVSLRDAVRTIGFIEENGRIVVPPELEIEPDPDIVEDDPEMTLGPEAFRLSWDDFQKKTRLTHALPYVYYQGKTVKDKKLMLMCVRHRHFTMRHLILGLGRVQKSENVWICGSKYETVILDHAKNAYGSYEDLTRAGVMVVPVPVDENGDVASTESSPRADEVVFSDDEEENWSTAPAAFNFDDDDDV